MGQFNFIEVEDRLRTAGLGFTEVLPLERVLEKPQARQPGKLRELTFRGLTFEVPEFPGQSAVHEHLPPPELGEHSLEVLQSLGYSEADRETLLDIGAVTGFDPQAFAWAPVRDRA